MSRQNKHPFYFAFQGQAWKLLIDPSESILVTEWREEETRSVNFSAIHLPSRKELWKGIDMKEKWWVGLEEAKNGKVILHGYKDIQNPEHKGIFVHEIQSGKPLWNKEHLSFVTMDHDTLIAYDPLQAERTFTKLSLPDGSDLGNAAEDELMYQMEERAEAATGILNSSHYTDKNKYFEKITSFIWAFTGKEAVEALDYLEFKGKIIVSFYTREEEKLVNYLLVVGEDGEILFQDLIGSEISGIGLETFFLYQELLIFVKNKTQLVIFEI